MSQNAPDDGTYTYGPQKQLPPSAQTIVINPPQSLPETTQSPVDPYATATAYRPTTDQYVGAEVVPQLKNARATITQYSRYSPSMVTSSSIPGYVSQNGVQSSGPINMDLPHDPTEGGSR